MNSKLLGGSLSALLLSVALAGCNGGGGTGTSGAGGGDAIATVGSSTVTRTELTHLLEGVGGKQVLPQLIDIHLLEEALKGKNQSVTEEEVNAELAHSQEQDPTIKTDLEAGGARADYLKSQARSRLTLQKLLTADIPADETKEQAFFKTYSSYYATPTQNKLGILAATTKVRADQLARSLKAKPDSFEALVTEQKGKAATDPAAGESTADVGRFETPEEFITTRFPPQLAPQLQPQLAPLVKALATAKKGQILPVQALSPRGPYLIVKVVDRKEASKPDFTKLHSQVETDYKLAQVAEAEIKKNPGNPQKLQDNIKQVIQLLSQPNPQTGQPGGKPTLREALTFILQSAGNNMLTTLRTNGTVQVSDPAYKEVAKSYQPAPSATGAAGNTAAGNSAAGNTAAGTTAAGNTAAATTNSAAAPPAP